MGVGLETGVPYLLLWMGVGAEKEAELDELPA